jgi:hypothetical protein
MIALLMVYSFYLVTPLIIEIKKNIIGITQNIFRCIICHGWLRVVPIAGIKPMVQFLGLAK